ncbi:predicted protein [Chaetoceros tenuissimus]|uniref:Uncharacterized protein n=1 Tax=Chaetoceros tenuissimus TaxID=426638 RepID=A0AAD3H3X7_9STRA|nr:predicted protein [Chaetoceros tenuissimus]
MLQSIIQKLRSASNQHPLGYVAPSSSYSFQTRALQKESHVKESHSFFCWQMSTSKNYSKSDGLQLKWKKVMSSIFTSPGFARKTEYDVTTKFIQGLVDSSSNGVDTRRELWKKMKVPLIH